MHLLPDWLLWSLDSALVAGLTAILENRARTACTGIRPPSYGHQQCWATALVMTLRGTWMALGVGLIVAGVLIIAWP